MILCVQIGLREFHLRACVQIRSSHSAAPARLLFFFSFFFSCPDFKNINNWREVFSVLFSIYLFKTELLISFCPVRIKETRALVLLLASTWTCLLLGLFQCHLEHALTHIHSCTQTSKLWLCGSVSFNHSAGPFKHSPALLSLTLQRISPDTNLTWTRIVYLWAQLHERKSVCMSHDVHQKSAVPPFAVTA